jgi:hypothetical protein
MHRFPIVERELRMRSRQWESYWSRVGAAASGMGSGGLILMAESVNRTGKPGRSSFVVLAIGAAIAVVVSGVRLAAQAFAREKREDTLGLLLLTPLRPLEIVLSKLASSATPAFYQFVAIIPVLALPIMAGGVSSSDFFLLVVGLANLAFLTTAVGLYYSTAHWDEKGAWTSTAFVLIFGSLIISPIIAGLARPLFLPFVGREISIMTFSPGYLIWQAAVHRTGGALEFGASLIWIQLVGWIFIRMACRALPTFCENKPLVTTEENPGGRPRWIEDMPPLGGEQTRQETSEVPVVGENSDVRRQYLSQERTRLLERSPALWLAMRRQPSVIRAFLVGGIGLLIAIGVLLSGHLEVFVQPFLVLWICFFINAGIKCLVVIRASYAFLARNKEDPLELLLSTTITPGELVEAQVAAIIQPLVGKVRVLLAWEAAWLLLSIALHVPEMGSDAVLLVMAAAGMLGLVVSDLHALAIHGLWQGVVERNQRNAENATLRLLVIPWICTLPMMLLGGALFSPSVAVVSGVAVWVGSSFWVNRKLRRSAEQNLADNLRLWSLRRAVGDVEHYENWVRVGRRLGNWWRSRKNKR